MPYQYEIGTLFDPGLDSESVSEGDAGPATNRKATIFPSLDLLGPPKEWECGVPLSRVHLLRAAVGCHHEAMTPDALGTPLRRINSFWVEALSEIGAHLRVSAFDPTARARIASHVAESIAHAWESLNSKEATTDEAAQNFYRVCHLEQISTWYTKLLLSVQDYTGKAPFEAVHYLDSALAEAGAISLVVTGLIPVWALPLATQRLYVSNCSQDMAGDFIQKSVTSASSELAGLLTADSSGPNYAEAYRNALRASSALYRVALDGHFSALSDELNNADSVSRRRYLDRVTKYRHGVLLQRANDTFSMITRPGSAVGADASARSSSHSERQIAGVQRLTRARPTAR